MRTWSVRLPCVCDDAELDGLCYAGFRALADVKSAFKLSEQWCKKLEDAGTLKKVLAVTRCIAGSHAAEVLQPSDLVLAVDGKTIVTLNGLEQHCLSRDEVAIVIIRDGVEKTVTVRTALVDGSGTCNDLLVCADC